MALVNHDYRLVIGNAESLEPQRPKMTLVLTPREIGNSVIVQAVSESGVISDLCFIKPSGECSRNMCLSPHHDDFYWEGVNRE